MAGLNVGDIETRVSFRYDGRDADRYERKEAELRRKSGKPIEQKVDVDADRSVRELDRYDRKVRDVDDSQGRLARGSGRLRGAMGTLWIGGAGVAAGALAFGGLAKGVLSANSAFEESAQISRQTNAVIKSTGGVANVSAKEVGNLATALSKKTGVDDDVIQSGENMLLTFTNVRNEVGRGNDIFNQATRTVTDMSVALGQDTKSSAIQLGKALSDPIKGVTALQRVGVTFTKQQKEQIATLVNHGKTVEAQKLILGELNKEFGGSAAAQNNWRKQLSVTWGNLQETIGGKLAPALEKAGTWVTNLMNDLMSGGKTASSFTSAIGGVARTIRSVFAGAFQFVGRYFGAIGRVFSETFGSGSGTGRDIRSIIRVLLSLASTIAKVYEAIVRRALPGIITAFRGLAQIVRGVIQVIAGILTGDFGKAWDGVKKIVSGGVKVVGGLIRALTAPFRETMSRIGGVVSSGVTSVVGFLKSLPGRAVSAVSSLPGALAGVGRRAVSAFASALSGLPGAIGNALKGGGSFLGGIGRGIADWINAHTPFGDTIKIGPVKARLPALASGGKVGPKSGGARVFIAGEGGADEWVISQEGDRRKNVQWAREALETLTGRAVGLFAGGKGSKRKKRPLRPTLPEGTNRGIKRSVGRGEAGIKDFERDIQRMERRYDQLDREYGMDDTELVIENEDGSATVDQAALGRELGQLGSLHSYRQKIADKYADYKKKVGDLIGVYSNAVARLNKAIKAAKGSARGKERAKYVDQRQAYSTRISELQEVAKDLDLDIGDQQLDLAELDSEKSALAGTTGRDAPAPADTGDGGGSTDLGGSGGDSTTGGDSGSTGDTTAPPSPVDIAAAALQEFANFNAARSSLFSSFGGNFMSREGLAGLLLGGASATSQAAGLRAFGAVPTAGGTTVNITNNFGGGPAEPGTWAQQQRFAVESAMGA